ncbi:hypothetical protein ACFXBB_32315 [Streptomyces scopuliridis]|uniref:hypothetical protein n=1 Tax=Streptomyces scopuliridis TaxID=452529 RepID=UPI003694F784
MNMVETGKLYGHSQTCQIWDEPVEYAPVRRFVTAATSLLRELGEIADSDLWLEPTRLVRKSRRSVCTAPLPFSSPALQLAEESAQLLAWGEHMHDVVAPHQLELLTAASKALNQLAQDDSDPLGSAAREFIALDDPSMGILALPNSHLIAAVEESMAHNGAAIRVGTYSALQGNDTFSSAAIVGSPSWIPPYLLNSPRGDYLAVIHYTFFHERTEVTPLLAEVFGSSVASRGVSRLVERSQPYVVQSKLHAPQAAHAVEVDPQPILSEEACSPTEEIMAALRREAARQSEEPTADASVKARIAALANGSYVLLPVTAEARILSVDLRGEPGHRVDQVPASSVTAGEYLALRSLSHHNDLVDRADVLLGPDAARLRDIQKSWKRQLADRARWHARGTAGVASDLRSLGATTANISYWTSSWCIRTRVKADFVIVMRYLGHGIEEADAAWENLGRIDWAHRRAGRRSVETLEAALSPSHLDRLERLAWSSVTLPENAGTSLIARIEDFLPGTHRVPVNLLCSLRVSTESR